MALAWVLCGSHLLWFAISLLWALPPCLDRKLPEGCFTPCSLCVILGHFLTRGHVHVRHPIRLPTGHYGRVFRSVTNQAHCGSGRGPGGGRERVERVREDTGKAGKVECGPRLTCLLYELGKDCHFVQYSVHSSGLESKVIKSMSHRIDTRVPHSAPGQPLPTVSSAQRAPLRPFCLVGGPLKRPTLS